MSRRHSSNRQSRPKAPENQALAVDRQPERAALGRQDAGNGQAPATAEEGPARTGSPLADLAHTTSLLDKAVLHSPADETEVVWIETHRRRVSHQAPQASEFERVECSCAIRVREGGRSGATRIDRPDSGLLASAIRQAMAHARLSQVEKLPPFVASKKRTPELATAAWDQEVVELSSEAARKLLTSHCRPDEAAILEWTEARVALRNSQGLARKTQVTAVTIQSRSGEGSGAGFFTQSARSLRQLDIRESFERARRRRAGIDPGQADSGEREPSAPIPVLLSPDATIELLNQLNLHALAGHSYLDGTSFLREHMGVQVFDRSFDLADDATDGAGLPFPFDLEGRLKKRIEVVSGGVPKTPMTDTRTAFLLGQKPTGHCLGGEQCMGLNLLMAAGEFKDEELLESVNGGLWIGRLDNVEVFDPGRMLFRARCRGVRRIASGSFAQSERDLIWEDSLLRVFSSFLGLGQDRVTRVSNDGVLGGITAPAVAISEVDSLRLAPPR